MKRIAILLLSLTLLLTCTACAAMDSTTVAVPDVGVQLNVPEGWIYGTPAMGFTSPLAVASGISAADFERLFGEDGYSFYAVDRIHGIVCYILDLPLTFPEPSEDTCEAIAAEIITGFSLPAEEVETRFIRVDGNSFVYLRCDLADDMALHYYVSNGAKTPYVVTIMTIASQMPEETVQEVLGSIRPAP